MGLSVREYARRRGVSHTAVRKAVQTGRIPQEADGTIDPVKADAAWDAQTDPGRRATSAPKPVVVAPVTSASTPQRETAPAVPVSAAAGATFAQARTAHEVAKAQKARIQVDRLKEEVVDRARATALVFKLARQERDAWITWPARVAGQMAAEIGIDPHVMQTLLEAHVHAHLDELAAIEPNFR
ncbi:elements of external origin [Magnetospirillum sp. 15-1]|uniref:elements of external origin n=1 Tax=Magnetospirillum sp. 15-1 TaxID=1979370 RepID=UPI000BBBFB32|nr:elements of external origin [Magnetospirillum sp. 15-1]